MNTFTNSNIFCTFKQVIHNKKAIKHDLPIQLGFFVYQQAKLKMLSFYYDLVDYFIPRKNYNLLEMDTGTYVIFNFYLIALKLL